MQDVTDDDEIAVQEMIDLAEHRTLKPPAERPAQSRVSPSLTSDEDEDEAWVKESLSLSQRGPRDHQGRSETRPPAVEEGEEDPWVSEMVRLSEEPGHKESVSNSNESKESQSMISAEEDEGWLREMEGLATQKQ